MEHRKPIVVVIPTYQERDGIAPCLAQVLDQSDQLQILVVDDNSPDGTGALVRDIASREPRVSLLSRGVKEGIGPAYLAGFATACAGDPAAVVQMDADLSHDPAELLALVAPILNGSADLVIGSRRIPGGETRGWGRFRNALSHFGSTYARLLLRIPIRDATSGYRAWNPALVQRLSRGVTFASGYGFQIEMAFRAIRSGAMVREVPITFRERQIGRSKMTLRIALEAAWIVIRLAMTKLVRPSTSL
jgi:dolichol-phosphate mannosyltransferase